MIVHETDRLILRRISLDDAEFIFELLNEPAWLRFIGDRDIRTVDESRDYIEKRMLESFARLGFGAYVAVSKEMEVPLGICSLVKRDALEHIDLGFAFLQRHWGQGYAFEASSALLAHASRELGHHHLCAIVSPDNQASIRLLEKLKFSFKERIILEGAEEELLLYDWNGTSR